MLKSMRKHTKVIIWTVVVSFALWGGFSVGTQFQKEGRYAGEVFGRDITFQEFNRFYKAAQVFSFQDEPLSDPEEIRRTAWQNLAYAHAARNFDIKVSDDAVRKELRRVLQAQGITDPGTETYRRWLQATLRMEPRDFEKMLREMMRIQQLLQKVSELPVEEPGEEEIREIFLFENRRLGARVAVFESEQEAVDFAARVSGARDWERVVPSRDVSVRNLEEAPLRELTAKEQISPDTLDSLYALEPGQVSDPVAFRDKWGVFLITSRQEADEEKLDEAAREKYHEEAVEWKRRRKYLSWHLGLMEEAGVKDYTSEEA